MKRNSDIRTGNSHPVDGRHLKLHPVAGAVIGLVILITLVLLGTVAQKSLRLPLTGPVVGLVFLSAAALLLERLHVASSRRLMRHLAPVGRLLLTHMGLFFVPAGVGIVTMANVVRGEWLCIVVALAGSTGLSLTAASLVTHYFMRRGDAS
jgi:holin-like protein